MAGIRTGLWYDRSQPKVLGATLTLPVDQGQYLLSFLALLVTVAGGSFWNLTALLLHRCLAKRKAPDAVGLQQQVALKNLGTSPKVIWESIKIGHAWAGRGVPRLWARTLAIVLPAALVWSAFSTATVLSARVATTGRNGDAISLISEGRCGFWHFDVQSSGDSSLLGQSVKIANDSIQARNYASTFYNKASVSPINLSSLKSVTLPFEVNTSAPCPFRNDKRCILGPNGAMSMKTQLLDSHESFGINSYAEDRVTFQYEATCSPLRFLDSVERYTQVPDDPTDINRTFIRALFGPYDPGNGQPVQNYTYQLYDETINTEAGYILDTIYAPAIGPKNWNPIPDFNRTDADVTMFFLSQNKVYYLEPTFDAWFSANGSRRVPLGNMNGMFADAILRAMGCVEQFKICNPAKGTDVCIPPTGQLAAIQALRENPLGFNFAQRATALRILTHMGVSTLYYSVISLGRTALWANDLLYGPLSPGLPENQWQLEAQGWFQTSLVKFQSYIVDFATNSDDLGPYGKVLTPRDIFGNSSDPAIISMYETLQDQCSNQLVRTKGEVQNFNFLGIMIIICFSAIIIMLNGASGIIISWVSGRRREVSAPAVARQADNIFHLLRMALGGSIASDARWRLSRWDIPIVSGSTGVSQPHIEEKDGLAMYGGSHTTDAVQIPKDGGLDGTEIRKGRDQVEVDSLLMTDADGVQVSK